MVPVLNKEHTYLYTQVKIIFRSPGHDPMKAIDDVWNAI
jgi:hypothetical protein